MDVFPSFSQSSRKLFSTAPDGGGSPASCSPSRRLPPWEPALRACCDPSLLHNMVAQYFLIQINPERDGMVPSIVLG
jgi:hypothetical protein